MHHMETVSREFTRARIRAFCHIFGTSLTHISRKAGISRVSLSYFMNGTDGKLSLRSLGKVHDLLDYLDSDNLAIKYLDDNEL